MVKTLTKAPLNGGYWYSLMYDDHGTQFIQFGMQGSNRGCEPMATHCYAFLASKLFNGDGNALIELLVNNKLDKDQIELMYIMGNIV